MTILTTSPGRIVRGAGLSFTRSLWHTAGVSEVAAFIAAAWRDGVGPDDRQRLAALLGRPASTADPEISELRLFAAWLDLEQQVRAELPAEPDTPAGRVLHRVCALALARLDRAAAAIDTAVAAIGSALEELDPDDPRSGAARALADLAIGDLAAMLSDLPTARLRYEAATVAGLPVALRITAMLRLAGAALTRVNIDPARKWARKAMTLAETSHRFEHGTRARVLLGMLEYAAGDTAAMRRTLLPHERVSPLARILLASVERASRAMPLLADGIRIATEQGDPLGYLLCILIGARRYAAIGRDADALITLSAGIAQLTPVAPNLAGVLREERSGWHRDWGTERFEAAERLALQILDGSAG